MSKVLDAKAQRALRELRALNAEKATISEKIKEREAKLKEALGDAEEGTVKGNVVVTWKRAIRQTTSLTLLKKGYPEIAAECLVQSEVRTFKVIEP